MLPEVQHTGRLINIILYFITAYLTRTVHLWLEQQSTKAEPAKTGQRAQQCSDYPWKWFNFNVISCS